MQDIPGNPVVGFVPVLDHARHSITLDGLTVPMQDTTVPPSPVTTSFSCSHSAAEVNSTTTTKILHAKYNRRSPEEVIKYCSHLKNDETIKLLKILQKFSHLFSGKLGSYVHKKFSINLKDPHTPPVFCNPYPVPIVHQQVFKKELQNLIDEKVLQHIPRSEWAFLTFLIPKKDGRVRWISDFCRLNKLLKRDRYFLPNIPTIMQKRLSFSFITKLDVSMGYFTFELGSQAQKYCVISTPFGLYQYLCLPMGLANSPGIFQSVIHPLFQDIPAVECFIDDIDIFTSGVFDNHLSVLQQIPLRLTESGFTVNPLKCAWAVTSTS